MKRDIKRDISSKELIDGAKSWLASFSDNEWCRKLEEENYLNELDEEQKLEWLNNYHKAPYDISKDFQSTIYEAITVKDERKFVWTLSGMYNKNKRINIPSSYGKFFIELEAA